MGGACSTDPEVRKARNILEGLNGRDRTRDLGGDGRLVFRWIMRKKGGRV
jgi:hypothetical protein